MLYAINVEKKQVEVKAKYDDPIVVIGASESYEARCRHCHEIKR